MIRFEDLEVGTQLVCKKEESYHYLYKGEIVTVKQVEKHPMYGNPYFIVTRQDKHRTQLFYDYQLGEVFFLFDNFYVANRRIDTLWISIPEGAILTFENVDYLGCIRLYYRYQEIDINTKRFEYYFTPLTELMNTRIDYDFERYADNLDMTHYFFEFRELDEIEDAIIGMEIDRAYGYDPFDWSADPYDEEDEYEKPQFERWMAEYKKEADYEEYLIGQLKNYLANAWVALSELERIHNR